MILETALSESGSYAGDGSRAAGLGREQTALRAALVTAAVELLARYDAA